MLAYKFKNLGQILSLKVREEVDLYATANVDVIAIKTSLNTTVGIIVYTWHALLAAFIIYV